MESIESACFAVNIFHKNSVSLLSRHLFPTAACSMYAQGELINESGTMTGGGGRPRSGRMCLGSAAPRRQGDDREAASELAAAEKALAADLKVSKQPECTRFASTPIVPVRLLEPGMTTNVGVSSQV